MSLRVVVRSPAETDLLESALFIAEGSPAAAQRFLDEAQKAFADWPSSLRSGLHERPSIRRSRD
jgi:plasmid stabilization system protein ParE